MSISPQIFCSSAKFAQDWPLCRSEHVKRIVSLCELELAFGCDRNAAVETVITPGSPGCVSLGSLLNEETVREKEAINGNEHFVLVHREYLAALHDNESVAANSLQADSAFLRAQLAALELRLLETSAVCTSLWNEHGANRCLQGNFGRSSGPGAGKGKAAVPSSHATARELHSDAGQKEPGAAGDEGSMLGESDPIRGCNGVFTTEDCDAASAKALAGACELEIEFKSDISDDELDLPSVIAISVCKTSGDGNANGPITCDAAINACDEKSELHPGGVANPAEKPDVNTFNAAISAVVSAENHANNESHSGDRQAKLHGVGIPWLKAEIVAEVSAKLGESYAARLTDA